MQIKMFSKTLEMLDAYGRKVLPEPKVSPQIYKLTLSDCEQLLGIEFDEYFGESILQEYPSMEETAANLLYSLLKINYRKKDIALKIFVYYLDKNLWFEKNGDVIDYEAFEFLTLLVDNSSYDEKSFILKRIMLFLQQQMN